MSNFKNRWDASLRVRTEADEIVRHRDERNGGRPLVNPLSGVAFDLEGADAFDVTCPPASNIASAETAGEMVELYWMANAAL